MIPSCHQWLSNIDSFVGPLYTCILPYVWAVVWGVLGHTISLFTSMSSPRNIIELKYGVYLCLYIHVAMLSWVVWVSSALTQFINLIWRCV